MKFVLLAIFVCFSFVSNAAMTSGALKPSKILLGDGTKAGGIAGPGFTLLDIKSVSNQASAEERLMIDVGDIDGKAHKGYPGYFQVELRNNSKTVIIDFAQMPASKMDLAKIQDKLKDSFYVKKAKLLADPSDDTLTLVLDLKKPAKLKVFQVPGEKTTSKVVLDLMS